MTAFGHSARLVRAGAGRPGSEGLTAATGSALADAVASEGLEGLLYARAVAAGRELGQVGFDDEGWHDARRVHARRAGDTVIALQALAGALARLARAGVEPVVLPGASLLRHYPDVGCRPMDDIDLLCPPGAGPRVRGVLLDDGWTAAPRLDGLLCRGGVTLDLHEDPLNSDRIRARRRAGWLDPARLWPRRRRVDLAGVSAWTLAPEDEVLYSAAHALRHSYRRLTWLIDLALQLDDPELDPAALAVAAADSGLETPLAWSLTLLDDMAAARLPAGLTDWLDARRPVRPLAAALRWTVTARHHTCVGELLWCLSCKDPVDRVRLLAEFVFPRPSVLLQVYPRVPRRLAVLTYPLRCVQLVGRALGEAATLAGTAVAAATRAAPPDRRPE